MIPDVDLEELVVRTKLSEVWKGKRRHDGAPVAVKFAADPAYAGMLRSEAETVEALEDAGVPGIVPAEFASHPVPHLILPWKGGRTLRNVIEEIRGGDDRSRAIRFFLEAVKTVAAVHRSGFLHGDFKPENVLVDDANQVWITDFGMSRAIRSARLDSHISRSMDESEDAWGGTLQYLPPEGLQGEEPAASWDVYAAGVMLHEILLGRRPDRAATPEELLALLPGAVVATLLRSLAYAPADRYPWVPTLLRDLREIEFELTATGTARLLVRSGRLLLTGLAAFFVALRYGSVFLLLAVYLGILFAAINAHPVVLISYGPFLLLHAVIRWEGPETSEEARNRGQETLAS